MTGHSPLPSVLGDGVYTDCQLPVRATKHKALQKVLSLSEAVLCTLRVTIPTRRASWQSYVLLGFCQLPVQTLRSSSAMSLEGTFVTSLNLFGCPGIPKEMLFIIN